MARRSSSFLPVALDRVAVDRHRLRSSHAERRELAPVLAHGLVDLADDLLRTLAKLLVELAQHDLGHEHLERRLAERSIEDAAQPRLRAVDVGVEGVRIEDDEHVPIMRLA